jgi:hypothetical protein
MANSVLTLVAEDSYSATFNNTGDVGLVDFLTYREVGIELNIGNVSGTSPTLDVVIEHQSGNDSGDWHTLYTFAQKTTIGISSYYIPNATQFGFLRNLRAKCTIGGTGTPTFSFSIIAIAKE